MPTKIVDLSARSEIIRDEPFHVHFWECTPREFLKYLGGPRAFLESMGIKLPSNCRVETTIENHDWLGERAPMGRPGSLEDVVRAILFFASPAADYLTGQVLAVAGGWRL